VVRALVTTLIEHAAYFTTLPREYYVSDEIFEREVDRIFCRQWLYAGHISQLPNRGDFRRSEIAGESVVLVLGDGETVWGALTRFGVRGCWFLRRVGVPSY
jgi:phenylpropionate dioxygenase-like ring-hydroxylating dioxygenase large terminal subunit